MIYAVLLALLAVVCWCYVAWWVGGLLRDAEVALRCTCSRHRVCPRCLGESEQIRPKREAA